MTHLRSGLALRSRLRSARLFRDELGQSTVYAALFLGLFLLGFVALGIDVGLLFHSKRMAQAAADAAAVAAAEESGQGSYQQAAANAMAKLNGFDTTLANNPAVVVLSTPSTGSYAGNSAYVQAVVSKPIQTFFLGAFTHGLHNTVTVTARAVAGGGLASPTCVCLEGATGQDLNMSNNAQISSASCGIMVDSSSSNAVGVVGSASISAYSLGTVSSTWNNSTYLSSNVNNNGAIIPPTRVVTGVTTKCAPNIAMPALPTGTPCYSNPIQGWTAANSYTGVYTLPQATETTVSGFVCYNSLDTTQSAHVTFSPGYTYYIKGDFTTGGGSPLSGSGVTFYVGGNVNIANGVTANLSAPTVNAVPQTLFYVNGSSVTIQGGSSSAFSGTIYAPNAAVTLNNGTGTTLNMDFVAQTLTMAGGATLTSYANSNLGTLNVSVAKVAE